MHKINLAGRKFRVPGHPVLRIGLGVLFLLCGFLGFLPVLGFWMVPVGLAILAIDIPAVRRLQRRVTVRLGYWLHKRWPRHARHFGYGSPRNGKHH